MPDARIVGGEDFELAGKMWDFREIWQKMAEDVQFVSIPQCGHLPREAGRCESRITQVSGVLARIARGTRVLLLARNIFQAFASES